MMLTEGFSALLAVPMGAADVTRGMIRFRRTAGRFDDQVVALMTALANQSKVAIDNARLFEEVERQRVRPEDLSRNLQQLYRLSTAMQAPLSLRDQLTRVLEAAREVVAIDRFSIGVVDPAGDRLAALAGAGFSAEEWRDFLDVEIPMAEAGAMAAAYREGRPLVFDAERPVPPAWRLRPPWSALKGLRSRSFLVVPMIARGQTVGLLTADNKVSRRPIPAHTVELLQIFAAHAAVAIDNARLFREIDDKSRQLEVASKHKSQFLANMSHELRTPLNAILGYTELLLDRIYGPLPDRAREVLERVQASGRHLLGLIKDVLDLSKIEAGRLTLALGDYSMKEVVQTAYTAVRLSEPLPAGRGDERRLTQVLLNLLGNAIKFSDAGTVTVTAHAENGAFHVAVRDTGPGIAEHDQRKIFEEFEQADSSSTRRKGGTGLGLAIARRIIELHGGHIRVDSKLGEGSTFQFTVPIRVERPVEAPWPVESS